MLDILRMAKNEELAVKMIFSAEQPLTGMNEGTWFPQRMCRKTEEIFCREAQENKTGKAFEPSPDNYFFWFLLLRFLA